MVTFRKFVPKDPDLSQLQANVDESIKALSLNPISNGKLITVSLTSGSNKFAHTLGRLPIGYIPISPDSAASIYQEAISDLFLTLNASATCNLKLWIF